MKEQEVSGLRIFEEKGKPGIEKEAVGLKETATVLTKTDKSAL